MNNPLLNIIRTHKEGIPDGIYSVCSSHRLVLEVAMAQALEDKTLLLIESTSNQVDQFGGYSGMTPDRCVAFVKRIADEIGLPKNQIILGGDHLGPNVWQNEPSPSAMEKAREQVRAYVKAGYSKIHLDTSMSCADDSWDADSPLADETIAERAADLCYAAEMSFDKQSEMTTRPVYVIGTEVPTPGGAQEALTEINATTVEHARKTIELTKQAFLNRGLKPAWERVIGLVVQPGVEFGDTGVIDYDREKARPLSRFIENVPNLVYEAHSTDFQKKESLRQMVEDHFAILKVGPALTFAFREAVFALLFMEKEWLSMKKGVILSKLDEVLERIMLTHPEHWQNHYHGDEVFLRFARKYSYSDRLRYYWPNEAVAEAFSVLMKNLTVHPPPLSLVSQYLPNQYDAIRDGKIENTPKDLICAKIGNMLNRYEEATKAQSISIA